MNQAEAKKDLVSTLRNLGALPGRPIQYHLFGQRVCMNFFGRARLQWHMLKTCRDLARSQATEFSTAHLPKNPVKRLFVQAQLDVYFRDLCDKTHTTNTFAKKWHLPRYLTIEGDLLQHLLDKWIARGTELHGIPSDARLQEMLASAPGESLIRSVLKESFPHVIWPEQDDFSRCRICLYLAWYKQKGQLSVEQRRLYEKALRVHDLLHRKYQRLSS